MVITSKLRIITPGLPDLDEYILKIKYYKFIESEEWKELNNCQMGHRCPQIEKVEAVVPYGITLKVTDNPGKLPVTLGL